MRSRYRSLNNKKFKLRYHLIFTTKYRRKLLNPIRDDLIQSFHRSLEFLEGVEIVICEVDKDHIHFLIETTPNVYIDKIVKIFKQVSTYDMWKKHRKFLSNYYWSGKHYLWTRGYFVSTVGEVSSEKALEYIKNQG